MFPKIACPLPRKKFPLGTTLTEWTLKGAAQTLPSPLFLHRWALVEHNVGTLGDYKDGVRTINLRLVRPPPHPTRVREAWIVASPRPPGPYMSALMSHPVGLVFLGSIIPACMPIPVNPLPIEGAATQAF